MRNTVLAFVIFGGGYFLGAYMEQRDCELFAEQECKEIVTVTVAPASAGCWL